MEDITYPTNQLSSTDHESNIWPIFERIVATNSTKVKQEILEEYRDESLLSRILYYAYNPHLNYYITGDALKQSIQSQITPLIIALGGQF